MTYILGLFLKTLEDFDYSPQIIMPTFICPSWSFAVKIITSFLAFFFFNSALVFLENTDLERNDVNDDKLVISG